MKESSQLRHVVLFRFKEGASEQSVQGVEKAFEALAEEMPMVTDFEWGTDVSPEGLSDGFTHCFFVTFKDEAGRDDYLPHPKHQAFVAGLQPILDKAFVVDYWTK